MKIISGDLRAANIQINCECCHATYELENREDFYIEWVFKPLKNDTYDSTTKIPEYYIHCPVCKHEVYLGIDSRDYDGKQYGLFNDIIMSRPDWEERYKVSPMKVIR